MATQTNVPVVIDYYRVWSRLPDMTTYPENFPAAPVKNEDYVREYNDSDLKILIKKAVDNVGGLVIDPAAIDSIPDGYLLQLYENLRYRKISNQYRPSRIENNWTKSVYGLPDYILGSVMITQIYQKLLASTSPTTLWKVNNLHRLIKVLNYLIKMMVMANPTGDRPALTVVSTTTEEYGQGSELLVTNRVYIDKLKLGVLQNDGWTAQSIADYWVDNKKQPGS